jgi:hypothetical protein
MLVDASGHLKLTVCFFGWRVDIQDFGLARIVVSGAIKKQDLF